MNVMAGIIVYLSLWVILLFIALPIGVTPPSKVEKGWDPGAPETSYIGKKILLSSLVAAVLWGIIYYIIVYVIET